MSRPDGEPRRGAICVICPGGEAGPGGIGRHVRYVTREWPRSGSPDPMIVLDSFGPGPRHSLAATARCAWSLLRHGLAGRISLVHIHMAANGSVPRKLLLLHLAKLLALPVVLHAHGSEMAEFHDRLPLVLRRLVGRSMARADAVIALSQSWRDFLVGQVGLDSTRVHVLPNAVPPARTRAASQQAGGPCRILFLGRVGRRKGVPELLHALAMLRDAAPWMVQCAGDGEVAKHEAMAAELGLADKVRFLGWVDETAAQDLLAESDLLVLPSKNEGLPMSILEAMAHGRPVIATPVGGVAELVHPGRTGLLVPPGDPAALAQALRTLIHDPETRRRMGAQAFAAWRDRYALDAYCRTLACLYDDILHGRTAARSAVPA